MIFTFFSNNFIQDQAIIVFVVISIFLLIEFKVSPYVDGRLKNLGLLSFVTLAMVVYSGTLFSAEQNIYGISLLFAIITLILNSVFYLLTIFYFIRSYRPQPQTIRKQLTPLRLLNEMFDGFSPRTIQPLSSNRHEGENILSGMIMSDFKDIKNDEHFTERVLSDLSFESVRDIPSEPQLGVKRMASYDVYKERVFTNRFNTILTEVRSPTTE